MDTHSGKAGFIVAVVIAIIAGLVIGGYFFFAGQSEEEQNFGTLPDLGKVTENPTEGRFVDTNPVEGANPFGSTYQNPFE